MNKYLPMLLFCMLFGPLLLQAQQDQDLIRCYSTEYETELRAKYPQMGTVQDFENWLQEEAQAYQNTVHTRSVYTIPIVFHIIHNGENVGSGTNLSATYVQAQLDQMNDDFRRLGAGSNNNPVGADVEIEFCMATIDDNGNAMPEPGINRINRNTAGFSNPPFSTGYINGTIKPATQWDPDVYFNFWVCNISGGILGYAQFPEAPTLPGVGTGNGAANTDGVVCLYSSIGSVATPNPNGGIYGLGRTGTHEVGHWLGLRHIWGDGGCSVDDYCNDTPTSDAPNYNCPSGHVSCGSTDMIENYMDYTQDNCMNIFTIDQRTRMRIVMGETGNGSPRRAILASSTACSGSPPPPPATCSSTTSNFPYAESFESNFGIWTQATNDDFNWSRNSGGTPSSNTGPSSAADGSWYAYMESSNPNYPSKTAILNSGCFDLSNETAATFSFQYHMYGSSAMGNLQLEARAGTGSWSTVWSASGNQGNSWQSASVDLSSYLGSSEVQLRYVGVTGTTWQGDMAIDDLDLSTTGGGGGCQDNEVTLTIVLDNYPGETTWEIEDANGNVVASGGPYGGQPNGSTVVETSCLPDGCYDFTIFDSYGDGICCGYGNGSYSLTDANGTVLASGGAFGSSETTNFCLNSSPPPPPNCPAIDFTQYNINSYGGSQDNGTFQVSPDGSTLRIRDNAWKSITYSYTVTANTVIEFEFRSNEQGEIHGIGFDNNNGISSGYTFRVYGTQNWGIGNYDNYPGGNTWVSYTIPVGTFYTGNFNRMFFVCDNDANSSFGISDFRNVKVYEGSCGTSRQALAAMSNVSAFEDFNLFPNPAHSSIQIEFNHPVNRQATFTVMDAMGRKVTDETQFIQAGENRVFMNVSTFQNGTYFLQIHDGKERVIKKFVVLK